MPDLDKVHVRMTAAKQRVVEPPTAKAWGRQATYRDPDDNVVSVAEVP